MIVNTQQSVCLIVFIEYNEKKYLKLCMDFFSQITLPSGAKVEYQIAHDWLQHIYVKPSIFDEDTVEGLCGNPNEKPDDFIPQGWSFSTTSMWFFQASWRYICRVYI